MNTQRKEMGSLVLGRRLGESIQIGDDITITFVQFHGGNQIKLKIEAPTNVRIMRSELLPPKDKPL